MIPFEAIFTIATLLLKFYIGRSVRNEEQLKALLAKLHGDLRDSVPASLKRQYDEAVKRRNHGGTTDPRSPS